MTPSRRIFTLAAVLLAAGWGCSPSKPAPASPTPMAVTSISPNSTISAFGALVRINGSGFKTGVSVKFGSQSATVTSVDQSAVTVITPMSPPGVVDVTVTGSDGTEVRLTAAFTFFDLTFTGISPTATLPWEIVRATGEGLDTDVHLNFGGIDGRITFATKTSLGVEVPVRSIGATDTVDVTLIGPNGKTLTIPSAYTYLAVTVTASTTLVGAGGALAVSWDNPRPNIGPDSASPDSVALYKVGDPDTQPTWSAAVQTAAGTIQLQAPTAPGQYEFRFRGSGVSKVVGKSAVVTVN